MAGLGIQPLSSGRGIMGHWRMGGKEPGKPECGAGVNRCNTQPPTNSGPGCSHYIQWASLWETPFYVCPGGKQDRVTINNWGLGWGADKFYCADWGCESMGTVDWEPPIRGDLFTLGCVLGPTESTGRHRRVSLITGPCMNFLCNPVRLKFSTEGKKLGCCSPSG